LYETNLIDIVRAFENFGVLNFEISSKFGLTLHRLTLDTGKDGAGDAEGQSNDENAGDGDGNSHRKSRNSSSVGESPVGDQKPLSEKLVEYVDNELEKGKQKA
jgi:hypothetical protein